MSNLLEKEWVVDPLGRIDATDAITIETRVAFWRVPGGDAEAVRQARAVQALVSAAPNMARALLGIIACAHADGETICARCLKDARAALSKAGVPLP